MRRHGRIENREFPAAESIRAGAALRSTLGSAAWGAGAVASAAAAAEESETGQGNAQGAGGASGAHGGTEKG